MPLLLLGLVLAMLLGLAFYSIQYLPISPNSVVAIQFTLAVLTLALLFYSLLPHLEGNRS